MTYNPQPTVTPVRLGGSASVNVLPEQPASGTGQASIAGLFPAETSLPVASGGVPPARLDFNALFAGLGATQFYLERGGVYAYNAAFGYDAGALVSYSGLLYEAVAANGPEESVGVVTPGTDADVWLQLGGGAGPWSIDRPVRIADYDGTNYSATYSLNEGSALLEMRLPSDFGFQSLSGRVVSGSTSLAYTIGTGTGSYRMILSNAVTGGASHQVTLESKWGLTVHYSGVNTNYTPNGYAALTAASSAPQLTLSGNNISDGNVYTERLVATKYSIALSSEGTAPASWSDTTDTCENSNGATVTLKKVHHTGVSIATSSGIGWRGFNTVGSTIMCCRMTETLATDNQYGELVAGSDLAWAAMDVDGGQINFDATGSLGLTGTWVKVSGQSIKYYGPWGMGLYRRIL